MKIFITESQYNLIKENEYNEQILDLLNSGQYELANMIMEGQGINIESFLTNILYKTYHISNKYSYDITFYITKIIASSDWWNDGFFEIYVDIDGEYFDKDDYDEPIKIKEYIGISIGHKFHISDYIINEIINEVNFLDNFRIRIKYN